MTVLPFGQDGTAAARSQSAGGCDATARERQGSLGDAHLGDAQRDRPRLGSGADDRLRRKRRRPRRLARIRSTATALEGLRNGAEHRFVVYDRWTRGTSRAAPSSSPYRRRRCGSSAPKPGTKVRKPPLLRWAPPANASYYNVQLFRGKTKVSLGLADPCAASVVTHVDVRQGSPEADAGDVHVVRLAGLRRPRPREVRQLIGKSKFVILAAQERRLRPASGPLGLWGYTSWPLADVAQLVEHFTRNEGVRGSSPRVGFVGRLCLAYQA